MMRHFSFLRALVVDCAWSLPSRGDIANISWVWFLAGKDCYGWKVHWSVRLVSLSSEGRLKY
jgi:hypothetical protein